MSLRFGLDRLLASDASVLRGRRLGVLCNQASITSDFRHILDALLPFHRAGAFQIHAVFGPEHGLHGHTQDNMIEWEGLPDPRTGLTIHSLYGRHREPTPEMMDGIELFVVDTPDVGARYYTFIWTMAHCLAACDRHRVPMLVLDRPNPIGGSQTEGPVLEPEFTSFVGLHPLPIRHGLTVAEVARYLQARYYPSLELEVLPMEGWHREAYYDGTGAPWAMPSPNMPTVDTAVVYPGGCLVEATTLSEGRGTTRPFEILGGPGIDGWTLADALNAQRLPGVYFRPVEFEPTFNKHARTLCGGVFHHVTDRRTFLPVVTTYAFLLETRRRYSNVFAWKGGPYEYEAERRPIDILAGNRWFAEAVEQETPWPEFAERCQDENAQFNPWRTAALLYA